MGRIRVEQENQEARPAAAPTQWQHPFVDAFKLCKVERFPQGDFHHSGKITPCIDRAIGKPVLQIGGSIPAVNYIQLPSLRSNSLGLTGQYVYCQVLLDPIHPFVIHVDAAVQHAAPIRISVSNLFQTDTKKLKQGSIQVAFAPNERGWMLLGLDLPSLLAAAGRTGFQEVRGLQLCATLSVRTVFTSDLAYSKEALPKAMQIPGEKGQAIQLLWLPRPPLALLQPQNPQSAPEVPAAGSKADHARPWLASAGGKTRRGKAPPSSRWPEAAQSGDEPPSKPDPPPEAFLELERIHGFTGECPQVLLWPCASPDIIFACGTTIIAMNDEGKQRYLLGHTSPVCSLAACPAAALLASAEDGRPALIRLWHLISASCLCVLNGHVGGSKVDIAADGRMLAAVGLDGQCRQTIIVWDISGAPAGKPAFVVARHTTDYHASCIRFCPFEPGRLVTCGRSSIRIYRLKDGVLRGISIQLGVMDACKAGQGTNIFTDIAFERGQGLLQLQDRHFYVSSAAGSVCQVNYGRRTLERIYQLHTGAINQLALHEGFCVTASDDRFLRIWPLDFSDFLLEAEHEAPVTSIGVSEDGLQIVLGTEAGSIGKLALLTQAYTPLLTSHTDTVHAVAAHPSRPNHFCTAAADSSPNGQRLFSLGEDGCLCVYSTLRGYAPVQYLAPAWALESQPEASPLARSSACMCIQPNAGHLILARAPVKAGRQDISVEVLGGEPLEVKASLPAPATAVVAAACSPCGQHLWCITLDRSLLCISLQDGRTLQEVPSCHRLAATSLAISAQGHLLASGGADGLVKLWPIPQSSDSKPAGTRDALLDPTACQSFLAHPDAITCVCFVGEDRLVSTSAGDAVGVWRITAHAHGACQAGIIPPGQEPSLFSTSAAGGLPDTPPIAQLHRLHEPESSGHPGDGQKRAPILQSVSGCPSAAVQQSGYPAYAVQDAAQQSGCDAAATARATPARGTSTTDVGIQLWSAASGHHLRSMHVQHCHGIQDLLFSPTSIWLLSISQDPAGSGSEEGSSSRGGCSVIVWDVATGHAAAQGSTAGAITAACWHPGSQLPHFLTASQEELLLWQLGPAELTAQPVHLDASGVATSITALQCPALGEAWALTAAGELWKLLGLPSLLAPQHPAASAAPLVRCSVQRCCLGIQGTASHLAMVNGNFIAAGSAGCISLITPSLGPSPEAADVWEVGMVAELDGPVTSLQGGITRTEAILGTSSGTLWYVDLQVGSPQKAPLLAGHSAAITSIAAAPREAEGGRAPRVASTAEDGLLRVWSCPTTANHPSQAGLVAELQAGTAACTAACFSSHPGQALVVGAFTDGRLRSFALPGGRLIATAAVAQDALCGAVPCPFSAHVLTLARSGEVLLCNAATGNLVQSWTHLCSVMTAPWRSGADPAAAPHTDCNLLSTYFVPQALGGRQEASVGQLVTCAFTSKAVLFSSPLQEGITEFDTACGQMLRRVAIPAAASAIAVCPGGKFAVVASHQDSEGRAALQLLNLHTWALEPVQGLDDNKKTVAARFYGQKDFVASAGSQLLWFSIC
ncbi:hypothetical protein WJX84_003773 [Apatococcus fuscideae]|uniref:CFA20 domain-containing protein n=1 Tax=Apatococcus fuscideae TaxID=2026836 RepID=A0AAW1T9J9_9CHLO